LYSEESLLFWKLSIFKKKKNKSWPLTSVDLLGNVQRGRSLIIGTAHLQTRCARAACGAYIYMRVILEPPLLLSSCLL
jgi:hypothetical protein